MERYALGQCGRWLANRLAGCAGPTHREPRYPGSAVEDQLPRLSFTGTVVWPNPEQGKGLRSCKPFESLPMEDYVGPPCGWPSTGASPYAFREPGPHPDHRGTPCTFSECSQDSGSSLGGTATGEAAVGPWSPRPGHAVLSAPSQHAWSEGSSPLPEDGPDLRLPSDRNHPSGTDNRAGQHSSCSGHSGSVTIRNPARAPSVLSVLREHVRRSLRLWPARISASTSGLAANEQPGS